MKLYKIRDKTTGLYSTGSTNPSWNKTGKTWSATNHVKAHIRQFANAQMAPNYQDAEIVEIEVVETLTTLTNVKDILNEMLDKELADEWNQRYDWRMEQLMATKYALNKD